ncbi:uncharacterized protein [Populus alba]|uniref:uncharacterized protein n=1 Tax=Populus alba TaxID=43335 RepID=UPI003CC78F3E
MNVAKRAKLQVEEGQLGIQVANGDTLPCQGCCKAVLLKMQSYKVLANLFLLTLGGCDIVLRVDWLRSLGTIQWNFVDLSMSFFVDGEKLFLQGLRLTKEAIKEKHSLSKVTLVEGRGIWLQFMKINDSPRGALVEPTLQTVLNEFKIMFVEPTRLPPPRRHNHQIQLQEAVMLICVKPYRYPYYQKEEIEKLVRVMLKAGIIKPGQSQYSSLVLLVRKADGSCKSIEEHVGYLRAVLEVLRQHQLYVKASKCIFGCREVEYLGYVIFKEGVQADPLKISTMMECPEPKNPKALRGFLGLTGYYRKFVKGYESIAIPLTTLLKKNSFRWGEQASQAFAALKAAMVTPPVLTLPNFSKIFVVECDASGIGLGAVLMQEGRPLSYLSQALKELLGFDFSVEYHSGKVNKAANALFKIPDQGNSIEPKGVITNYGEAKAIGMVTVN